MRKIPETESYKDRLVAERKCHTEGVVVLKYLIEPESFISSGNDLKVRFWNLNFKLFG
jgi:WD40 repeat protein